MSWMVRMLRSDPRNPWHWVRPAAAWHKTERDPARPPGYDTVCGDRALPLSASELCADDVGRACCCACLHWVAANHPNPLADLPPLPPLPVRPE